MKAKEIHRFICLCTATFGFSASFAQYHNSYMDDQHLPLIESHYLDRGIWKENEVKPMAFRPFILPVDLQEKLLDAGTEKWSRRKYSSWAMRKVRNEHLVQVEKEDFSLRADPVFNLQYGREKGNAENIYTNTRGYDFRGNIGKYVFFASSFYESQSTFPAYTDSLVQQRLSVPGMGRWKPFKNNGYDYAFATGYVGVAVNERIHFQFGHNSHFLGYGHRSLLLSDANFNYPALRSTVGFFKGKLQLTNVWTVLQSLDRIAANYNGKEALMQRKAATFHYLHFQPAQWVGIGFFEGTIWNTWDSVATPKPIAPAYFIPVPGVSAATEHGITSQILGLNYFVNPFDRLVFYGQLGLNRFYKGSAHQFGGKYLSAFGIAHLDFFAEYNYVSRYFYAGRRTFDAGAPAGYTEPYGHNGHPLGLNTGDNREEIIAGASYRFRDFFVTAKYHQWKEVEPKPVPFEASMVDAQGGYVINPKSNMQLCGGAVLRKSTHVPAATHYFYIAFRTNLLKTHFDF